MTEIVAACVGLVVGFLIGIALDDALDLYRASRKEHAVNSSSRTWPRNLAAILLAIVLVGNFAVGILLIVTRASVADYSRCTASWQQQFSTSYKTRLAASIEVDKAQDDVFRAVAEKDERGFKTSLARYVQLRDDQAKQRKDNPLPPLPETLCGKPTR